MPTIGPNATLRVGGAEEHDVGTITWTETNENNPYTPLGKNKVDRFTRGPDLYTWTAEVQTNSTGATGIDWSTWRKEEEEKPIVITNGGLTERLVRCVIDSIENSTQREDGTWTKSISGKAVDHEFE
jgi:hypothetical protein